MKKRRVTSSKAYFGFILLGKKEADLFNKNWLETASPNATLFPATFQMGFPKVDIILVLHKHTF